MRESQTRFQTPAIRAESVTKNKSKAPMVAGVIFTVLFIGAGAVLGAFASRVWDPLWNPFRPSPEEVLGRMGVNMAEVKTSHTETKMEIVIVNEAANDNLAISIISKGDTDVSDIESPKSKLIYDVSFTSQNRPDQISFSGEARTLSGDNYLKISKIIFPDTELISGIDLSGLKNHWIKFDDKTLENLELKEGQSERRKEQQREIGEKLNTLFGTGKIYTVEEELPDKKIGNKKVYHYALSLDTEQLKTALPGLFAVFPELSISSFSSEGLIEDLSDLLDKIGKITFELQIGKEDNLLYNLRAEKSIDLGLIDEAARGRMNITIDMSYSGFNKPITIDGPEQWIRFEDVFEPLLESLSFPSPPELPENTYSR